MKETIEIRIQVDKEVRNKFKALTALNNETMTEVIMKAIDRYIDRHKRLLSTQSSDKS